MSKEEDKVKDAFANSKYTWRTVRGIAKETGVSPERIKSFILTNGDEIVKSSVLNQKGEQLFASRKVYRRKQSPLKRLISAVINRGG